MTDITRLLASLKRRAVHAKEFGHDVLFVKIVDIDALVEALEKAQQLETKDAGMVIQISKRLAEAYKRIAELESRTVTVKLPADRAAESEVSGYDGTEFYRTGWNARGKADKEALTAQGIKWEAE